MAKRAKVTVAGVNINCPACGEGISAPNWSFLWTDDELTQAAGDIVECDSCSAEVLIPALVFVRMP